MPAKKTTTRSSAPRKTAAPKVASADTTAKFQRPAPTKVYRPQVVTHVKTMSNGEPRPKSRRSK